jgi:hypothetical protein
LFRKIEGDGGLQRKLDERPDRFAPHPIILVVSVVVLVPTDSIDIDDPLTTLFDLDRNPVGCDVPHSSKGPVHPTPRTVILGEHYPRTVLEREVEGSGQLLIFQPKFARDLADEPPFLPF